MFGIISIRIRDSVSSLSERDDEDNCEDSYKDQSRHLSELLNNDCTKLPHQLSQLSGYPNVANRALVIYVARQVQALQRNEH